MTQQVIKFCDQCQSWRHITNFSPGITYCHFCYNVVTQATEGFVTEDGTMKDSEFEAYMMEPIVRAMNKQTRERKATALGTYIDLGRFPTRRPVKRRRR